MIKFGILLASFSCCLAYPGSFDASLGVQSNAILTPFSSVGDTVNHAVANAAEAKVSLLAILFSQNAYLMKLINMSIYILFRTVVIMFYNVLKVESFNCCNNNY